LIVAGTLTFASGFSEGASLGVPQSLTWEPETVVVELSRLAARGGAVGAAAEKALPIVKAHFAKEVEFVFPPLGILPDLAKGQIAPEMKAAVAMGERAKAAEQELWNEHAQITSLMNDIVAAGRAANDEELVNFATGVAAHSLNEMEVLFPAAIVIGEYLQAKMPETQQRSITSPVIR
jgi:hypothetical protein